MNSATKKPDIIYNKQIIRYSFIQRLVNIYGPDEAGRIIYRAKEAKNIMAWVNGGLSENMVKGGKGYALLPVFEELREPKKVKEWIDKNIFKIEDNESEHIKKGLVSIRSVLEAIERD